MTNPWSHIGYLRFLAATGGKKSEIDFHNIFYLTQQIQKLSFQCVTNLKVIEFVYRLLVFVFFYQVFKILCVFYTTVSFISN